MRYRKWTVGGLCVLLVLWGSACGRGWKPVEEKKEVVTFGWIGPLTGVVNFLGVDGLKAVQMAVDEYNKSKKRGEPFIKIVVADDQYTAKLSLEAYRKMVVQDKIDVLFLNTYTAMFDIADEALRDGVIVVNPIDNDANLARLNKNIFMVAKETEAFAGVITKALIKQGRKRAGILCYNQDDFMPTLAREVERKFEGSGGKVMVHYYVHGRKDFSSSLKSFKNFQSDALIFLGYYWVGFAMKQAREMGMKFPFYAVNIAMQESAGEALEGTQFANFTRLDGNTKNADLFLDRYQKKYSSLPKTPWTAFQAFDAANIMIRGVRKASQQGEFFADRLRDALLATSDFEGVSGNLTINPDGTSRGITPSLYVFREGRVEKLP